jgi:hypothetical protein
MPRERTPRLLLALLAGLVLLGGLLLAVLWLGTESIGAGGKRLVGSWRGVPPTGGGAIVHSFQPDGTVVSRYYADSAGAMLQDVVQGRWNVEDSTLLLWTKQSRFTLGLKRLVGMEPAPKRIPIVSVTEQAISFGKPDKPIVYDRLSGQTE